MYAVLISAGRQQSWDILFLQNKILLIRRFSDRAS